MREIDQLSLLIDSQDYYQAFVEVGSKATSSLHVAGWEIDGRMILNPLCPNKPINLRQYLNQLAANLHEINLFSWKAPMYLLFGRERFSYLKWKLKTSKKIKFTHNRFPYFFGSYHEKIAIFDHQCAFIGGIDLAKKRWDTQDHNCQNQLRKDWNGQGYNPIHDVQFVLTGEIVQDLEEFVQKRSASNLYISQQSGQISAPLWPDSYAPELKEIKAAISRTEVEKQIYEIESLYKDAIRCATDYILIENQYFSHHEIITEICHKLEEEVGPEIIIILPILYRGWFESSVYISERNKAIKKMRQADKHQRLRILYPHAPSDDEDNFIVVHSKTMIIDNVFLTMGSANLNFRSMRVDREINLSFEAGPETKIRNFITDKVCGLMAEHLDVSPEMFRQHFLKSKSLIGSIDLFKDKRKKTLREIPIIKSSLVDVLFFLYPFVDLKKAVPKEYAYWACGGIILFLLIAAKVMNGN